MLKVVSASTDRTEDRQQALRTFYQSALQRCVEPRAKVVDAATLFAFYFKAQKSKPSVRQKALLDATDKTRVSAVVEKSVELQPETQETTQSWQQRLKQNLSKTRKQWGSHVSALIMGGRSIDDDLLEEIESQLLAADVGIEATGRLIHHLTEQHKQQKLKSSQSVYRALTAEMVSILSSNVENPLLRETLSSKPFVLLVVGVNGVGKTTTIGKIAHLQKSLGRKVLLAAGDTFRAAAIEQLGAWGQRLEIPVIAQKSGADSASVIYDGFSAAMARGRDLLIADTAGRLHTKSNLMQELAKVKRVLQKLDPAAPHAVLLVLDAGNGQNALLQAREFHKAVGVSGIALTKLDGTAKGGISLAIRETLDLPLWYIGVGESIQDLRPFNPKDFVDVLLPEQEALS